MIQIKNISKSFGNQTILDNVSLDVKDKKITVIIGKSGAGKSILLKLMNSLIIPENGKIEYGGNNLFDLNLSDLIEFRKKTGILFQGGALFDSMNVFQNVAFPLVEHFDFSEKEIHEKVVEALKMVDLENILGKMPSELSGGMKKRVALARSIVHKPEYLFYDEPTTGLDPITAANIIQLIENIHNEMNITSVVVTHDRDCVSILADDIVMVYNQKIYFSGTYSEFKATDDSMLNLFK